MRCWLTLLLCAFAATASAQGGAVVPRQVSPSVWMVQGQSALGSAGNRNFISNAGFIVTPAGVVVVDALGAPVLARELLAQIRRITPLPVTHVIVTHYHADHIYGLQVFQDAGAKVLAHRGGLEYLGSTTAQLRLDATRQDVGPALDAHTRLVPADQWLDAPHGLILGGMAIQLIPMGPAHTPEDLVVHVPSEGVLFAGDLVFRGRIPFVGQADSKRWMTALDEMLRLQPRWVVPGHGPLTDRAAQDMRMTRDYLAYLRSSMRKAAENMDPFDDAYQAVDWSAFEKLPLFGVANRMNAYNTYLLMEREAK